MSDRARSTLDAFVQVDLHGLIWINVSSLAHLYNCEMDKIKTLRRYGLFDAKVPRYTSYPPANRFEVGVGQAKQKEWLRQLDVSKPVSIYVHIPFCKRLCWFCACRTQGTRTMRPVDDYISAVLEEMAMVSALVPKGLRMERLHLGGGTPTLLTSHQMGRLLSAVHELFSPTQTFEFSVEIDPTDASDDVLDQLSNWGLGRASIGVQDFDPKVQKAIGRHQSVEETQRVISKLRSDGVRSLNIDLLYGLPFQTSQSLLSTLEQVMNLSPDRLALYGYAHVPHVSKRQVMIDGSTLADAEERYALACHASKQLKDCGYQSLGIDHFALPQDSLAIASANKTMKRNFQGYTDDPCETLLGFGASAISQFRKGYIQNTVATAAYRDRVGKGALAGHKGYVMSQTDKMVAYLIESLMCRYSISISEFEQEFGCKNGQLKECLTHLKMRFSGVIDISKESLNLDGNFLELARVIAAELDEGVHDFQLHSSAI